MGERDRERWDCRWRQVATAADPNPLLVQHRHLLRPGIALDVACGLGQNTRWLAEQGLAVLGLDISFVALRRARRRAAGDLLARRASFAQVDLDHFYPPRAALDLICVFRFLDRSLIPRLKCALRPAGLLIYQTRHEGFLHRDPDANPAYLLHRGELSRWFDGWQVIHYREGIENAEIVVRKRNCFT